MRILSDIAGRTLRIFLALLIGGVLIFFALTRTEVGRDGLRREIERSFSRQFQGELTIRQLKGNLVSDLFASDVRLYDPAGNLVLSADSAVIRPRWRDLFRRSVSVGRVTLYRPDIHFIREPDGSWTLAESFQPHRAPGEPAEPWSFTSTQVQIIDGTLQTSNRGTLPEAVRKGHLFNYTQTKVRGLDAVATIEWRPDVKLIDVLRASAAWPEKGMNIDLLQGQLVLDKSGFAVNEFKLETGQTVVQATGSLNSGDSGDDWLENGIIALDIPASHVENSDLRRFFPSLPVADAFDLEGRVSGPISDLVVEHALIRRGRSVLEAEGTLTGLPERLGFDVAVAPSTVDARDLLAVWPAAEIPDFRHLGLVSLELTAQGLLPFRDADSAGIGNVTSTIALRADAGTLSGTVDAGDFRADALTYTADLSVRGFDVGHIVQEASAQSRLNGTIRLEGRGVRWDSLQGQVQVNLGPSSFAGRAVDSLAATAVVRRKVLDGLFHIAQGPGRLSANGEIDLREKPSYRVDVAARRLDAGLLLGLDSLQTDLQGNLQITGSGLNLRDLAGRLDVSLDSSEVWIGSQYRMIPPNQNTLVLTPSGSAEPAFTLTGDAATVRLHGDVQLEPLIALGRLWVSRLAEYVSRELDKPHSDAGTDSNPFLQASTADSTLAVDTEMARLRETARVNLDRAGLPDGLAFTADFRVHQPELLSALLPVWPDLQSDLRGEMEFHAGADSLFVKGSVQADSLQSRGVRASGLEAAFELETDLEIPLDQSLIAALDANADSLTVAAQTVARPSFSFHFGRRAGQASFTTQTGREVGPLQLAAALDLLPDRNRLTLFNLRVPTGSYEWTSTEDYPIDLYSDAIVIPGLTLESRAANSELVQKVHIHGTISSAPGNLLYADVENLSIRQLSGLIRTKKPLRGLMKGQLALSGSIRQPELTGSIEVPVLAYGNEILGRLEASSRFVPGSPDIALDVTLSPVPSAEEAADLLINGERPAGPVRAHANAIHLGGTFRLPQIQAGSVVRDPGTLNLALDVSRAGLFFMEEIFPGEIADAQGYAEGSGTIGGTFRKPLPDIQLQVKEGRFRVPEFNLNYTAEGPVRVDAEGIKLDGALLGDATGGTARIEGTIHFNDYKYFSFDLSGVLDELRIMNVMQSNELPFYGQIWASGEATLTGPVDNATLRSASADTSPESEIFIPLTETGTSVDPGFIIFADSTGKVPDVSRLVRRENLLSRRPSGERTFVDGLNLDLNIYAPPGSTVHLVIDPLLGDVINAVGTGRIQLQRLGGEFFTYGNLDVTSGDYLFTAGDVFARRFLIDEGTIIYDGDPTDAQLNITASYRTRASSAGLDVTTANLIPMIVQLGITGRVTTPAVNLSLAVDRRDNEVSADFAGLETRLNQPERAAEYATSVLLTNSFLLTTGNSGSGDSPRVNTNQIAFNSLSQLVGSQINRYLNQAIPNLDVNLGLASNNQSQDLDLTYGVALRLLDERLIIRGQGVYDNQQNDQNRGEFVVEVRLSGAVAVEVFYRREGDLVESNPTNTTGAGLSYQTQFPTWKHLMDKLFGWIKPDDEREAAPEEQPAVAEVDL